MYAVFKREFLSYFRSPVGYIAIALFSFLSGFIYINLFSQGMINISSEINSLRSFFVIIVPIITMGLFAEDRRRGTEVIYYTTPVNLASVVFGKFLAALSLTGIMFVNVFIHMIVTKAFKGVIGIGAWGSVIVYFFLAAMFISIGIFASAITDSQIISAITAFVIILVIQLIATIGKFAGSAISSFLNFFGMSSEKTSAAGDAIYKAFSWLDPLTKTQNFRYGVFGVIPLFYCLSVALIFIYLTYRVLEKKRWSQK